MGNQYQFNKEKHVHLLNGVPLMGTSTVCGILSKELTFWAAGKSLELLGWTPTKTDKQGRIETAAEYFDNIRKLKHKEYLALLDKCYRNHKDSLDRSADKGVNLHAELERFIKNEMADEIQGNRIYDERILPFIKWQGDNVKKWLWAEAHCFSKRLWTGGICDAGALMNDGTVALIDFKSSKEVYLNHYIQCAGYHLATKESGLINSNGETIYLNSSRSLDITKYIIFPFGAKELKGYENPLPIDDYMNMFSAAVLLYKGKLAHTAKESK